MQNVTSFRFKGLIFVPLAATVTIISINRILTAAQ